MTVPLPPAFLMPRLVSLFFFRRDLLLLAFLSDPCARARITSSYVQPGADKSNSEALSH